ncbi:MAG: hypothetical protein LUH07_01295, partial [Lachnospiraceae bacterium]|nr:hypothetical protein [Lachnospiraceae bacterium]
CGIVNREPCMKAVQDMKLSELTGDMITMRTPDTEIILKGQVSLEFIKKQDFFGSWHGMRYRIHKKDDVLDVAVYPGPYCWDVTKEDVKEHKEFPFTSEGFTEAVVWLNETYRNREWP